MNDGARERWEKAYPGLDIEAQLRRMDAWLRANPAKARYRNWERFVTGWLSREQGVLPPQVSDDDMAAAMARRDAIARRVDE